MRLLAIAVLVTLLLLTGLEVFLRIHYGLCDAVLMRADEDYEYIAQPNQDRKRLGNRVVYNSLSMRSDELREGSRCILCLGDSILNGGTLTDQEELATSILSKRLSVEFREDIQVLNVSAGSWGPDNCLAWLKKHGDYGATAIILVVSSHDVHDTMTFVPVVGQLKNFPSRQYPLALFELWDRYIFPKSTLFSMTKDQVDESFRKEHHIEQTDIAFNPGFAGIKDYAQARGIPFAIYLHATLQELLEGSYDQDGQAIIAFCEGHKIQLVRDLGNGLSIACIRDKDCLHYSRDGQQLMVRLLLPFCHETLLKTKP